jgi:hypothetical protein
MGHAPMAEGDGIAQNLSPLRYLCSVFLEQKDKRTKTKERQAMKKIRTKKLILTCAIGIGMGISVLLPLATNGDEMLKGGPQMMKRSQPYVSAAERKAETKKAVQLCQSCCNSPVSCCTKGAEKK